MKYSYSLLLGILFAVLVLANVPSFAQIENRKPTDDDLPTLREDEAIEKLKETGQYDLLMESFNTSRLKDGQRDNPTTEDAIGQTRKLLASDAASGDSFGWSIAISGDTAVVGAAEEDTAPNMSNGAVYIFVRIGTNWTEQAKLVAPDAATGDYFGNSVAISGDTVVIGADREDTAPNSNNGAIYIFVRSGTTWAQQAKLLASDAAATDFFGRSVAISGDTVVVGAHLEDTTPNTDNGAAYIFVRSGTTWNQQAKLLASDAASSEFFGYSVAISGDTVVVGAYREDTAPNTDNGAAYIFVRSGTTWTQQAKLLSSDAATNDQFGYSVAISGETVIVGAATESTAPITTNGAAYIFVRSGTAWTEQAKLMASDAASYDYFGYSVGISGDTAVIGARQPSMGSGAAYVLTRSGTVWVQQTKLFASDAAANDQFGNSVAISGDTIIIGAEQESTAPNTNNGAAYIFRNLNNNWQQESKKVASDGAANDNFGISVAISGDTAIVGAYREDTAPNTTNGAAYIFVRTGTGWIEQAKLLASDASTGDLFGYSVGISGDTAIVGAYGEDTGANLTNGAAYVFVRSGSTWTEQAKLLASDAASDDWFGYSVAISGDTVIVGAYQEDTAPNTNQGAAYVFIRSGASWTQQAKLLSSDAATNDRFGYSVAVSGETVIIGADAEATAPNISNGAAYVFVRNGATWTEQAKLLASDAVSFDHFGWSVAISGNTAIVGAYSETTAPNSSNGAAYVFVRSGMTWSQQAKLLASDAATNDRFGYSVGISGDTVVVGAYEEDTAPNTDNGAVYVFVRSGTSWTQQTKLLASDAATNDRFGTSVGISGDKIVVGAPFSDTSVSTPLVPQATDQGAALFFIDAPLPILSANVSIGGRVMTASGEGVRNAIVTLTKPNGEVLTARTGSFGYYRFDELAVGEIYVLYVNSKSYSFEMRVVQVNENITNADFIAQE